jgi:cytochrome c-type biogenesis protein CcmH/NrfF
MPLLRINVRAGVVAALLAASAFADTAQIDSEAVRRVASHIGCQCGACKETAACPMSMQGCGFCVPAKTKIVRMQKAGFSDQAIIDSFVKQYGPDIYRAGPNGFFWAIPYAALVLGAGAILWFVRGFSKSGRPAPAGARDDEKDDANLAKYRDAIEKEVGRLD